MKSILLAEDDPFILEIYSGRLKKEGHKVTIATDGAKVLENIKTIRPDLLVLDINLPNISGWEILRSIRGDESLKGLPVIVVSNINPQDYPDDAKSLEVKKFFLKVETTPEEIVGAVGEILN